MRNEISAQSFQCMFVTGMRHLKISILGRWSMPATVTSDPKHSQSQRRIDQDAEEGKSSQSALCDCFVYAGKSIAMLRSRKSELELSGCSGPRPRPGLSHWCHEGNKAQKNFAHWFILCSAPPNHQFFFCVIAYLDSTAIVSANK